MPGIEDDEDDEYFGPDEFDGDDMEYDVDTHAPFELEELEAFLSEDPEDFHEDECWFTDEPTDVDLAPEDFDGKHTRYPTTSYTDSQGDFE